MSSTDIELMVKEANVLGRLARGGWGALKAAPKGALWGAGLGALATPFLPGVGLAAALGVGGAGAFSGAMVGGGLRGGISGLRGLLKTPASTRAMQMAKMPASQQAAFRAGTMLPAVAAGGGLGYMLSGDDNKMMGTAIGVAGGLMARPAVMRAIAKRGV